MNVSGNIALPVCSIPLCASRWMKWCQWGQDADPDLIHISLHTLPLLSFPLVCQMSTAFLLRQHDSGLIIHCVFLRLSFPTQILNCHTLNSNPCMCFSWIPQFIHPLILSNVFLFSLRHDFLSYHIHVCHFTRLSHQSCEWFCAS